MGRWLLLELDRAQQQHDGTPLQQEATMLCISAAARGHYLLATPTKVRRRYFPLSVHAFRRAWLCVACCGRAPRFNTLLLTAARLHELLPTWPPQEAGLPIPRPLLHASFRLSQVLYVHAREPMWVPLVKWSACLADLELVACQAATLTMVALQPERTHFLRSMWDQLSDARARRGPWSILRVDCEGPEAAGRFAEWVRRLAAGQRRMVLLGQTQLLLPG